MAQIPSVKEPVGLLWQDSKRPDGTTILHAVVEGKAAGIRRHSPGHVCQRPRQQHSHGNRSCSQPFRHQQDQQIQATIRKSHLHSSGHLKSRYHQAVELVQELGSRVIIITGDSRETIYLFQQLSVALQKGNAVSFQNTFTASYPVATSYLLFLTSIFSAYGFVLAGNNK